MLLVPALRTMAGGPIVPPYNRNVSNEYPGSKNMSQNPQGLWGIGGGHFRGSVLSECLATPQPPQVSIWGTAGNVAGTYYCVAMDMNKHETIPSAATVVNDLPASLSTTNRARIFCPGIGGALGFIVLKTNTSSEIGSCIGGANAQMNTGQGCEVWDTGQPPAVYVPKVNNTDTCGFITVTPTATATPAPSATPSPAPTNTPAPTATPT